MPIKYINLIIVTSDEFIAGNGQILERSAQVRTYKGML